MDGGPRAGAMSGLGLGAADGMRVTVADTRGR